MRIEVRVPTLSDSVASGTLLPWRRQVGDTVARDETLVDLETDKVILEIPAPASGTLVEIIRAEGESVKAEEVIAVIETGEGLSAVEPEPEKTPVATRAAPSPLRGKGRGEGKKAARSPGVRTLSPSQARERGQVAGNPQASQSVGLGAALFPSSAGGRGQGEGIGEGSNVMPTPNKREPMSRLRQRIAERLVAAQRTAALLTTFNEVNMAPVNALRQRYKAEFEVKHGVKLGYMSFFVRAVCGALQQLPVVNAAIDGNDIVWHADADIGIAISTPRGLVVPILRHAQTLSAADIERAIADFASRAVDNRLTLEELAGGTFSITNGGVFGSLLSTPILNPPQSAILGMHAIQERPIAEHGQVVVRPMMYLALTYDHRLIDGRDAVQFLVAVKNALETPDVLLGEV